MEDVGRLRMWKEGRMMEDGRMIAKKSISCMRVLCIYRTLLAAQKRIRAAILSTDHSLFTLVWTQDIEGEFLKRLWESMPRRVAAVLDAKGWYTKY